MNRRFLSFCLLTAALSLSLTTPGTVARGKTYTLVNSTFRVNGASYVYFPFAVLVENKSVLVNGRFRAAGGRQNDITGLVLDSDQFENFRNGNTYYPHYNSGSVTVGNVNVRLPPGQYYLVFNNPAGALISYSKNVSASVFLNFEEKG